MHIPTIYKYLLEGKKREGLCTSHGKAAEKKIVEPIQIYK